MKHNRQRTIILPLRKICSTIPAVALISGGIVFSASGAPTADIQGGAASDSSPVVVVPDTAMTLRVPAQTLAEPSPLNPAQPAAPQAPAPAPQPLVPILPTGTDPASSSLVTLDSNGIPVRALDGYRLASTLTDAADPGCNLDWALVAAIGRVESNHARFGGNVLDTASVARPGIIGIPLDGLNGTARITDTDGGLLDRDTTYDRAVGPMQFIPGTWSGAGTDADGDGVENPQDMDDAATAAAVYLCSGPGDLSRPGDLRGAILRYNASDSYVRMVVAIADAYRQGVRALPARDLAPAITPSASSTVRDLANPASRSRLTGTSSASQGPAAATSTSARPTSKPGIAQAPPATAGATAPTTPSPTTVTAQRPGPTSTGSPAPGPTSTASPTPAPTSTPPSTPTATSTSSPSPDPTATATATPSATSTPPTPDPTVTASPTPTPTGTCVPDPAATASPTPTETCLPTTCLPTSEPAVGCPAPATAP